MSKQEINDELAKLEKHVRSLLETALQKNGQSLTVADLNSYDLDGDDLIGVAVMDDRSRYRFRITPNTTHLEPDSGNIEET